MRTITQVVEEIKEYASENDDTYIYRRAVELSGLLVDAAEMLDTVEKEINKLREELENERRTERNDTCTGADGEDSRGNDDCSGQGD